MEHRDRAVHALNRASEHAGGAKGALWGALGLAFAIAAGLAAIGLMLTPIGWALFLILGALAGCFGLFKKVRHLLSD